MSILYMVVFCWMIVQSSLYAKTEPIDLEANVQDFIVETKQIVVPGFPGAFNASVIRWQGSLLLCFRVRNENMISTFQMGFVWLDENFNPKSKPSILQMRDVNPACLSQEQDPRLITIGQRLYILYSNFIKIGNMVTRRMFTAEVQRDNETFFIKNPCALHPFEGWSARWEKNWVPFVYHKALLVAYSLLPHRIFKPSLTSGACASYSATSSSIAWDWGDLRGGTPGVRDGNEYIAFFHSAKNMATVESHGKVMPHYVMGAYTFAARPPFEITRMSPVPIVGRNFYNGPAYTTWKPLRVVFPMGCLVEGDYIWVTYGRQDFEIWVVKIDKKRLYATLIPTPVLAHVHDQQLQFPLDDIYNTCMNIDGGPELCS